MRYMIEWCYACWRFLRDAAWGLIPHPEAPVPMPEPLDRAKLFAQLAALRAKRAGEAEQHERSVGELEHALIPAQAAVDSMRRTLAALHAEQWCQSLQVSAEEDRLLAQITEKGSMSLVVFIEDLDAELDILNRTEDVVLPSAHRDYSRIKKVVGIETDGPSRKRRAVALNAARARACQMQHELLSVEELTTELMRLRRSLPSVDHEVIHNERASIAAYN